MKYCLFRMNFSTGLHVGRSKLTDAEITISADTLFSAMCIEALHDEEGSIENLVSWARSGKIRLTDAFPYHYDTYYIPKPMIQMKQVIESDSVAKKNHKKMKYIPIKKIKSFCEGSIDAAEEVNLLKGMGRDEIRTSNTIDENGLAKPYPIGIYSFSKDWGLYFLVGYEDENILATVKNYLMATQYSGIGGRKSSGLGRFTLEQGELSKEYESRLCLEGESGVFVSLTTALPKDEELDSVLETSNYAITRRGGFTYSDTYSDSPKRKRDIYMLKPGSSFASCFDGDVYDVSIDGTHPVYKYGMPIFLEV